MKKQVAGYRECSHRSDFHPHSIDGDSLRDEFDGRAGYSETIARLAIGGLVLLRSSAEGGKMVGAVGIFQTGSERLRF